MNGRLYDRVVGRMLSPDNFVQMPDFTQNFNRYSYVLNNPLKFTDPAGHNWVNKLLGDIGINVKKFTDKVIQDINELGDKISKGANNFGNWLADEPWLFIRRDIFRPIISFTMNVVVLAVVIYIPVQIGIFAGITAHGAAAVAGTSLSLYSITGFFGQDGKIGEWVDGWGCWD